MHTEDTWNEARKRMADGLQTLLCFDFGVTGTQLHGTSAWILDHVIRPEFEKALGLATPEVWCIMQLDPEGRAVVTKADLSQAESMALGKQLSEQRVQYWIQRQ